MNIEKISLTLTSITILKIPAVSVRQQCVFDKKKLKVYNRDISRRKVLCIYAYMLYVCITFENTKFLNVILFKIHF